MVIQYWWGAVTIMKDENRKVIFSIRSSKWPTVVSQCPKCILSLNLVSGGALLFCTGGINLVLNALFYSSLFQCQCQQAEISIVPTDAPVLTIEAETDWIVILVNILGITISSR